MAGRARRSLARCREKAAPSQNKSGPEIRGRFCVRVRVDLSLFYWVGNNCCENPIVLTDRNTGVLGGRYAGPSVKFVSNW